MIRWRQDTSLPGLEQQLEHVLGVEGSNDPVRTKLAIARGYLELARTYGEKLNAERVVAILSECARDLTDGVDAENFLFLIRTAPELAAEYTPPAPPVKVTDQEVRQLKATLDAACKTFKRLSPKIPPSCVRYQGRIVTRQWLTRYAAA